MAESAGFGDYAWDAFYGFERRMNAVAPDASVKAVGLRYRALGVFFNPVNFGTTAYIDSIYDGVDKLEQLLRDERAKCPDERFVRIGYSQGALVIHLALLDFAGTAMLSSNSVSGVVLIADPAKFRHDRNTLWEEAYTPAGAGVVNADGIWTHVFEDLAGGVGTGPLPSQVYSRTIEICHNHDIVCAPGAESTIGKHTSYVPLETNGMGAWTAEKVLALIGR